MLRLLLVPLVYILLLIPCQGNYTGPTSSDPKVKAFFDNVHSPDGTYCCDESDGHPYYEDYKINKDGSVTLPNGYIFPKGQIVTGNPTGHAIIWERGSMKYCFSPGPLT